MKTIITKSDVVGKIFVSVSDKGITANAEITRYTDGEVRVNYIRFREVNHDSVKVQQILAVLEQEFSTIGVTKSLIYNQQ